MYNFRTDLAMERTSMYKKANKLENIDGIETQDEEVDKNIKVNRVNITNKNGEEAIGKIEKKHFRVVKNQSINIVNGV